MKKTVLYESHKNLNAKIVDFADYKMPISYPEGITSEYFSIRNNVGIFDVSHMGEIIISGPDALFFLQKIITNDVSKLNVGCAQYSVMCNDNGGIIDDFILYRRLDSYMMVVNASNIIKDYNWLKNNINERVNIKNISNEISLIAIQGPKSSEVLSSLFESYIDIPFYTFKEMKINGLSFLLSRTGYTGELGFEVYANNSTILYIWNQLLKIGVKPAGLASRDILRLEMAYCLYGNDIDDTTNPIEANLSWVTSLNKGPFIGLDAILKEKKKELNRKLVPFSMKERGIPRKGYEIFLNNNKIGNVTSGTQSPILNKGIGMGYINSPYNKIGQEIFIKIRKKYIPAYIVKPPFISNNSLYN